MSSQITLTNNTTNPSPPTIGKTNFFVDNSGQVKFQDASGNLKDGGVSPTLKIYMATNFV